MEVLQEEWRLLGLLFLALLLQSLISIVEPWPLPIIFDHMMLDQPAAGLLVRTLGPFLDGVSRHLLTVMVSVLGGGALVNAGTLYVPTIVLSRLTQRIVNKRGVRLFPPSPSIFPWSASIAWAPEKSSHAPRAIRRTCRPWWKGGRSSHSEAFPPSLGSRSSCFLIPRRASRDFQCQRIANRACFPRHQRPYSHPEWVWFLQQAFSYREEKP